MSILAAENSRQGTGIVERLMARLPNIIPITTAEITLAMRLMLETRILSARDAIHGRRSHQS